MLNDRLFAISPLLCVKTVIARLLLGMAVIWAGSLPMDRESTAWGQDSLPETRVRLGARVYTLEQATTPEQLAQGLMYRTHLSADHGMLFVFPSPTQTRFWMKHTLIPLDMIFLSGGRVIFIQRAVPPCPATLGDSCPTYGPGKQVDQVIELPAGTAQAHGLRPGLAMLPLSAVISASPSPKSRVQTIRQPGERRRR